MRGTRPTAPRRRLPATLAACLAAGILLPAAAAARPTVFVSILPQKAIVERIGDGRVEVEVMVPAGRSPETYSPTPRQMASLGEAAAYFSIGVPFEQSFLPKIRALQPELPVVDMCVGIALRPWSDAGEEGAEGDAAAVEGHARGAADPHVWLDPELGRTLVRNAAVELARLDPEHASQFEANRARLDAELTRARERMSELLAPYRGRRFYVFHPAFGYVAAAHGLVQMPIEAGGHEPTARELSALIDSARADGARALFVQPQYSPRSAKAIAQAIGARIVQLDDLSDDYPDSLVEIAERLADAFASAAPRS